MTINFHLPNIGDVTLRVPDALVRANVEALVKLGFSPSVTLDSDSERV